MPIYLPSEQYPPAVFLNGRVTFQYLPLPGHTIIPAVMASHNRNWIRGDPPRSDDLDAQGDVGAVWVVCCDSPWFLYSASESQ